MIEVIDRIPTYPGRVKLIPVPGQENTYDMIRADSPIEDGTPINKALFESIKADVTALQNSVSDIINSHAHKTILATVPAGTEFVLYEGGIRVPFVKIAGEYGGTGRSLIIRKHIYKVDTLMTSSQRNTYANGKTDRWLNNETTGYVSLLDEQTKAAIIAVPIESAKGNGNNTVETIDRKIFLLSYTEFGFSRTDRGVPEGTAVAYFNALERRKAQYNGAAAEYWTRTPFISSSIDSMAVATNGAEVYMSAFNITAGIRPAFTLPSDFEIDLSVANTDNTVATAEVV